MTKTLLRALYNTAGLGAMAGAALPVLLNGRWRRGLGERLGVSGGLGGGGKRIWVHGSSVGEALAARGLVEGLRTRHPELSLTFTTFTSSGRDAVRSQFGDLVSDGILPLDWNGIPGRILQRVRPSLFIVLETELWPNLLDALQRRGCPAMLVNGRLSERSFPRYRALKWFFGPFLQTFTRVCVRTEVDGERFRLLGVSPERIRVTGNIKYDRPGGGGASSRAGTWAKGGSDGRAGGVVVAGSLRGREHRAVLEAFSGLRESWPELRLVLAPRHPERFDTGLLDGSPLRWARWSEVGEDGPPAGVSVILVDTVGELSQIYGLADLAFVGGTFEGGRGHNLLEPASHGVPVLFGPGYRNFLDEGRALLAEGGGFVVEKPELLAAAAAGLLQDRQRRTEAGRKARAVAERFAGALVRTLDAVDEVLEGAGA